MEHQQKRAWSVAPVENPGAIAGLTSKGLQQFRSAILRGMTGICSLNRRVRSRTHGGVGGEELRGFSLSRLELRNEMSELIRSVELKLNRAGSQVHFLTQSISTWVAHNPITADCKLRDGRLGFQRIQKDFAENPPLDEWSLLLGECVHNLRSALDNLAFALARVRLDPPEKPNRIAFPIYQNRGLFEKNGRGNIDKLPDAAAALIERLQPFQRNGTPKFGTPDRDALVLLQSLSNADKHRVPSVVLLAPTDLSHNASTVFYSDEDASANVPPDATIWAGPLQPGVVLMELRTNKPLASVSGKFEGHAIVAIQSPIESVAVAPTLMALHQYTTLVISQFGSFFQ